MKRMSWMSEKERRRRIMSECVAWRVDPRPFVEASADRLQADLQTRLADWLSRESELVAAVASAEEKREMRGRRLAVRVVRRFAARRLARGFAGWRGPAHSPPADSSHKGHYPPTLVCMIF